jgi:hypothetical protein
MFVITKGSEDASASFADFCAPIHSVDSSGEKITLKQHFKRLGRLIAVWLKESRNLNDSN